MDEEALIIGSLLHDIGKVYNRVDINKSHQEHSADFINNNLNINNDLKNLIFNLVKYHHQEIDQLPPQLKNDARFLDLLKILKEADKKSAEHERDEIKDKNIIKFMKKIFLEIFKDKIENLEDSYIIPTTLEDFMNRVDKDDELIYNFSGNVTKEYEQIIKKIEEYFKKLDFFDINLNRWKINTLNSILMSTTRFIPAAYYYSDPNVPLYDHLKMTAALSLILYRQRNKDKKRFLLIYGDIIGVQKYIFKYFKSSSADNRGTKRIRGRSVMIKIVNDSIINYILDKLNLYQFNVLFDSSDKFFIIADYSEENINKLEDIRKNVEKFLFEKFRDLNVSLVWDNEDLEILVRPEKLNEFVNKIIENAAKRKYKLSDYGMDKKFFIIENSDVKICEVKICEKCGLRPVKNGDSCDLCSLEEKIGKRMVKIDKILRSDINISGGNMEPMEFKYEDSFTYFYNFVNPEEYYLGNPKYIEIISINSPIYNEDNLDKIFRESSISWRYILQGNFTPKKNDDTKSIEDLVCIDEEIEIGRKCSYIGIFKADVDNMGKILKYGIKGKTLKYDINDYNFTKYSAFSFFMNLYFTVILNKIAEKNDIYIAYAGGDDVVAVGEINKIISFAKEINNTFRKWISNPEITISAGVSMIDNKYPLLRGIEGAESMLLKAKNKDKNSIAAFDVVLKWGNDKTFEKYLNLSEDMYNYINKKYISRSLPYFLLELSKYSGNSINGKRTPKKIVVPDPYLYYYFSRNWKSHEINYEDFVNKIIKEFENIRFISIYTILRLRRDEIYRRGEKYGRMGS